MTKGSKKVFLGIILASIHIEVTGIILFPSCFGYALLYFGICDLTRDKEQIPADPENGRLLRIAAASLVIISGLVEFLAASQYMVNVGIWQMLPFILEYVVLFHLMEIYAFRNPEVSAFKRGYALVMGMALLGLGISLIFSSGIWQIFSGVVMLVCRFMALAAAYGDKIRVDTPAEL